MNKGRKPQGTKESILKRAREKYVNISYFQGLLKATDYGVYFVNQKEIKCHSAVNKYVLAVCPLWTQNRKNKMKWIKILHSRSLQCVRDDSVVMCVCVCVCVCKSK